MFKRKCPECGDEITYKSESGYNNAIKNNRLCRRCASSGERNAMYGKIGELNPFYGKKHTEESKIKIIDGRDYSKYKTKEFRDKISKLSKGSNNSMYGKSFYDVWLDKYGKEIADNKMLEYREKQSQLNSGVNNSMYGKPSPNGSGNGWSGWYNGWFFRSLIELTYMIKIIERYNLSWESGESNKFKIEYIDINGEKKNYFPDFIINNKYIVEIKPKSLFYTDKVFRKIKYAKLFCQDMDMIYKITSPPIMETKELVELYNDGKIKFTKKYDQKFIKKYCN